MSTLPAEVLELLHERQLALARERVVEYSKQLWPDEVPSAHHLLMLSEMQGLVEGRFEESNLLITAPPGSAKTSYVSHRFASWYRGKYPKDDLIAGSHTQELADKSARRVRNTCLSEDWMDIFGQRISQDSSAVNRWTLQDGGDYFAVGVGGTAVGRRAKGFLGDDVSGGIADAIGSTVTRTMVWDWYCGDIIPRLKPGAWQILVGTCFHSEDFIGKIRQQNENAKYRWQKWRIINLPMIAEDKDVLGRKPGQRLWPEYFTEEMVERARENNDTWMALYQQRPIVESGQYFKKEWCREYDRKPDNLRIYGASDYAVTQGGGDYTVHLVIGVAEDGKIYFLDCWRGQTDPSIWIEELIKLVVKWKPIEWFEEKGQITKGVGSFIEKGLRESKGNYVYRSQYAMPRGADGLNSKQVGAQPMRGRMAQGMVYFPKGSLWFPDMYSEMMAFPTEKSGIHDDTIDAASLFFRALDRMVSASKKREPEKVRFLGIDENGKPEPLTIGAFIKHSEASESPTRERI